MNMSKNQLRALLIALAAAGAVYALLMLIAKADCVAHSDLAEPVYTWRGGCHSAAESPL